MDYGVNGLASLIEHAELFRTSLAPLALPPVLCAVILMNAQGVEPQWGLVVIDAAGERARADWCRR